MSSQEKKINDMLERLKTENNRTPRNLARLQMSPRPIRPNLPLPLAASARSENETDRKLKEIMKISGELKINGITYMTHISDMEHIEELGNGTCGHVVKMRHKPSGEIIAVKQMRRSGNSEENKRITMDIDVVIKSHDCSYIVQCLGCFITDAEVWICMELMSTCFDKLLKRLNQAVPEEILGKVTVATVKALSYLKEKHGVIHRDVKPSNILLDERGNVKLCDFGISGRLVDSMAKTRSAGCAAYMAPERIEPDPKNPDYDIRADVWSLGITLVELATGVFPYNDCQTDFEVLAKVIAQDPPTLPIDKEFSGEFRQFVTLCLTKDPKKRPKYMKLQKEPFIRKYEVIDVNVSEWFRRALPRHQTAPATPPTTKLVNGTPPPPAPPPTTTASASTTKPKTGNGGLFSFMDQFRPTNVKTNLPLPPDGRAGQHMSRLATFQNAHAQPPPAPPPTTTTTIDPPPKLYQPLPQPKERLIPNVGGCARSYSPFRPPQSSVQAGMAQFHSLQDAATLRQHLEELNQAAAASSASPYFQRRTSIGGGGGGGAVGRGASPIGSPLPLRNQIHPATGVGEEVVVACGNVSPIVLQRFMHQQKQQQKAHELEEACKNDLGRRKLSYIKMQLSGTHSGGSSRHQSPEPPPRHNRGTSLDNQSPLALRRNHLETNLLPIYTKRTASPSPPIPPPRRLSESTSVPGSPQHLIARFNYTPEPQRRIYQNSDVSS